MSSLYFNFPVRENHNSFTKSMIKRLKAREDVLLQEKGLGLGLIPVDKGRGLPTFALSPPPLAEGYL